MNCVPFCIADSIFEIPMDFYKEHGIKYLIVDLDNTLDPYYILEPSRIVVEYLDKLKETDIKLVICSNNSNKRVEKYAKILDVKYLSRAFKPFKFKVNRFLNDLGICKENALFIGDQLLTDIKCGNKLKIKTIYVNELATKNANITKVNKFFEKFVKNKLIKNKLLINWRDFHVSSKKS